MAISAHLAQLHVLRVLLVVSVTTTLYLNVQLVLSH